MPGGDRTGPMGAGPRTGRGMGYCSGFGVPGYMNRPGFWAWCTGWLPGMGRGGRGFRHWFYRTGLTGWQRWAMGWPAWGGGAPPMGMPSPEDEINILKRQAESLSQALGQIQQRMEELEKRGQSGGASQ